MRDMSAQELYDLLVKCKGRTVKDVSVEREDGFLHHIVKFTIYFTDGAEITFKSGRIL